MRTRLSTATTAVATATLVPAFLLLGATAASADSGESGNSGNSGDLQVSEVGGAADQSNDPHVGCTFDLQWYGFARSEATVRFASQAPTKSAEIKKVAGPDTVALGTAAAGTKLNTIRTYTLAFSGADPQAEQGYHVKVTSGASGSNGSEAKTKVFWVQCDRSDAPSDPGTPSEPTDPGTPSDPGTPTDPGTPSDPGTPATPFDWNWKYADPTCTGVTVNYPADIPDGQANDVNVRVDTLSGTRTLNFHDNEGFWSGEHTFTFADHPQWDASASSYDITWVQVGGTNYHWKGDVACSTDGNPETPDTPLNDTQVDGFRTAPVTVERGSTPASDSVVVDGAGDGELELQVWQGGSSRGIAARSAGHWTTVKTVATAADGSARVSFPRLTKRGTYQFRLAVVGATTATGTTTDALKVRVR